MEFIYKLLGIASAVAEDVVTDPNVAVDPNAAVDPTLQAIVSIGGTFFPLIIVFVLMYFMLIRPEKKRKKKEQEMLASLKRGDRICTIGGIYGTIADIKDDTITLTVGRDNMSMVVTRWAIRSVEDVTIENESESLN